MHRNLLRIRRAPGAQPAGHRRHDTRCRKVRDRDRDRDRDNAGNAARLPPMRPIVLALCVLILGGCVEYRESIVLERDESGTVVMAIGVKAALLRAAEVAESGVYDPAAALDTLRELPGLQIVESRAETSDGMRWLHVVLTFESLAALNGINRIEQYRALFGSVALTENDAGRRVLTRTVRARLPEAFGASFLPSLIAPVIAGYPWSYEVRLPARVVNSNGDMAVGPDDDARVVRWTFNLADLVSEPRVMRATFARTGVGPAGIAVGAGLMVCGIAVAWMLQRSRNSAADS